MRRALLLLGLAAVAGLGTAVPAPAAPRAADFAMPVAVPPAGARAAAAPAAERPWTSPVLRAPRRFDVFGLRWGRGAPEHVHVHARTRRSGGRWSPWTELGEAHAERGTDPTWAGDADELQVRLEHRVRGLRAHFVSVTGAPRPAARAARAGAQPAIVPREAWGAAQCKPRDAPTPGQVQMAFVHHTVGTNAYTPEQSAALVLGICRYHRNANGWDDLGYNFLVDRFGTIFEGRAGGIDQAVVGAQAQGFNGVSTGVANLGTHSTVPQSEAALASIARLLAWKLPLHGVPVTGTVTVKSAGGETNRHPAGRAVTFERISGHRDGNATSCPGDALYAQLPRLRELADLRAPDVALPAAAPIALVPAQVTLGALATRLAYPAPAQLAGRVTDALGQPLAGAPVAVQMLARSGFATVQRTTTGPDGAFAATLPTARNRSYRAVRDVPGADRVASPAVPVSVAPAVTATAAARVRAGRRFVVSGTVAPRKAAVFVSAARRLGRGRHARPAVYRRIAVRDGRFRAVLRLRRTGLYRVRAGFAGDALNAPSRSADVLVRAVRRGAPLRAAPAPAPPPAPGATGGAVADPAAR